MCNNSMFGLSTQNKKDSKHFEKVIASHSKDFSDKCVLMVSLIQFVLEIPQEAII